MSYGILDSTSHVLATVFLIYRVAGTSFEPLVVEPLNVMMREHRLRLCGSIEAANANLDETWREAKGAEKALLKKGYSEVRARLSRWRDDGVLPTSESCKEQMVGAHQGAAQPFGFELYRLDEVDDPHRRVNWRYRIVAGREI